MLFLCTFQNTPMTLLYSTGTNRQEQYQRLKIFVNETIIGEILASVKVQNCKDLYQYYLHDFVTTVHKHIHKLQQTGKNEVKVNRKINTHHTSNKQLTSLLSLLFLPAPFSANHRCLGQHNSTWARVPLQRLSEDLDRLDCGCSCGI